MSKNKQILMWVSAILMIVSGVATGIFCAIAIFNADMIEKWATDATLANPNNYETMRNTINWIISIVTAGSVVGIVFGGISIKFCMYDSIEFYQKKSVVLTVAIICTLVVNILVGALYLVAVLIKDENLNLDAAPETEDVDVDRIMQKIEKLKLMREQDLINDEEFNKLKADILKGTNIKEDSIKEETN